MASQLARALRKQMTPQEVKLWVHLGSWKAFGCHFRRQAPRDGYILDFLCLKTRLIIEVDGGHHNNSSQLSKDRVRDEHFKKIGFQILRFWNIDVDRNLDGVLGTIFDAVQARHPPPRPFGPTLPQRGRD
jgi:very-short-patch-repair endonuclease